MDALERLRRDWDGGDLDHRVELLGACLEAGALSPSRLRLAAFLGDESAAFVADCERAGGPPVPLVAAEQILRGPWRDRETRTRIAVASARAVAPGWREAYPDDPRVPEALDALEAFVCGLEATPPSSAPAHAAVREHRLQRGPSDRWDDIWRSTRLGAPTAFAIDCLSDPERPPLHEDHALIAFTRASDGMAYLPSPDPRPGQFRLYDLVARELLPWALGLGDPLRERVAGRR